MFVNMQVEISNQPTHWYQGSAHPDTVHRVLFYMDSCPPPAWGQLSFDKPLHTSYVVQEGYIWLQTLNSLENHQRIVSYVCLFQTRTGRWVTKQASQPGVTPWRQCSILVLSCSIIPIVQLSYVKELPQDSRLNISSEGHKVAIQILALAPCQAPECHTQAWECNECMRAIWMYVCFQHELSLLCK